MRCFNKFLVLLTILTATGCDHNVAGVKGEKEGASCTAEAGCNSPLICLEGLCKLVCTTDADCAKNQICENSTCQTQASTMCMADEDCVSPSQCQKVRDAYCEGAKCHYLPKNSGEPCNDDDICTLNDACDGMGKCTGTQDPCDTPPASYCDESDKIYYSYTVPGTCKTENDTGCIYNLVTQDCFECKRNCAGFCENVRCEQQAGSCLVNVCDPYSTADPPCSPINKATGSECTYDADSDGVMDDGFCADGECRECTEDKNCEHKLDGTDWPECYSKRCVNFKCVFDFVPDAICGKRCQNGVKYRTGECVMTDPADVETLRCTGEQTSCGNYACANYDDCATDCDSESDCMPTSFCSNNECIPKFDLGDQCSEDVSCLSGFCSNDNCCEEHCAEGFTCSADGKCRQNNGAICSTDNDCYSGHCIDGYCCESVCGECQSCGLPGQNGICTNVPAGNPDNDTCPATGNKLCNGQGKCLLLDAQSCSSDGQCYNGHCIPEWKELNNGSVSKYSGNRYCCATSCPINPRQEGFISKANICTPTTNGICQDWLTGEKYIP